MEIKGTAVKSIPEFVRQKYPDEYVNWVKALTPKSQEIMDSASTSSWYSLKDAAIDPSKKVAEMFFNNDIKKGAWDLGRFSAEVALNGIYKIYVKLSSPAHIVSRGSRVFAAYYTPSKMEVVKLRENMVNVILTDFNPPSDIIEYRIAGWMERALEISGCKAVQIKIEKSLTKGDSSTIFQCSWN
jgi:hypothetical protein